MGVRKSIQPLVYDMMLLAQALIDLREHFHVHRWEPLYPKRENAKSAAKFRIRKLARFWAGDLVRDRRIDPFQMASSDFNWTPERHFYDRCWEPVDESADRPMAGKERRLSAHDVEHLGPLVLEKTREEIDRRLRRNDLELKGDTKRWYGRFKKLLMRIRRQTEPA